MHEGHHHHSHPHDHGHTHDEKIAPVVAMLTYMLEHNRHHAAELEEMADKLNSFDQIKAAESIRESVRCFDEGNGILEGALQLIKGE